MKKTNIGFCFLSFAYIEWVRHGRTEFDLIQLWQWTCLVMEELAVGNADPGTNKTRERIIKKIIHKYDIDKWDKNKILKKNQIKHHYQDEEQEVEKMWVQFLDEDGRFCGGAVRDFFIEEYKTIAPVIIIGATAPESRMYTDPKVEYFYQTIKGNGGDYYSALESMGVPELEIDPLFEQDAYQAAYERAMKVITQKIEAQRTKKALDGDLPAINAYTKQRDKQEALEDVIEKDSDPRFEIYKQPRRKKSKKEFKLDKPEINPADPI